MLEHIIAHHLSASTVRKRRLRTCVVRQAALSLLSVALVACAPSPESGAPSGPAGTGGAAGAGGAAGSGGVAGSVGGIGGTGGVAAIGGIGGLGGTGVVSSGACKAGHYIGEFSGKYRSVAWGNGADTAALDVTSTDDVIAMTVGLEFWLVESGVACAPGEEFCGGFTITGGKMRGNAAPNPLLVVPFNIDLTGDLDCNTGEFRGQLSNGYYEVGLMMARATFAGDITATYDHPNSAFINGNWDVAEDPPAPGATPFPPGANIGGEGTWSAGWVAN